MQEDIFVYELTSKTFEAENSNSYTGYGIAKRMGTETVILIEDITTDAALLSNFVVQLNRAQLPLIHLDDVVNDLITSLAML